TISLKELPSVFATAQIAIQDLTPLPTNAHIHAPGITFKSDSLTFTILAYDSIDALAADLMGNPFKTPYTVINNVIVLANPPKNPNRIETFLNQQYIVPYRAFLQTPAS